jgi:hypothetical protein
MTVLGHLAPSAAQDGLLTDAALPVIELVEAVGRAERLMLIVGRQRQLGPAALITAADPLCVFSHAKLLRAQLCSRVVSVLIFGIDSDGR